MFVRLRSLVAAFLVAFCTLSQAVTLTLDPMTLSQTSGVDTLADGVPAFTTTTVGLPILFSERQLLVTTTSNPNNLPSGISAAVASGFVSMNRGLGVSGDVWLSYTFAQTAVFTGIGAQYQADLAGSSILVYYENTLVKASSFLPAGKSNLSFTFAPVTVSPGEKLSFVFLSAPGGDAVIGPIFATAVPESSAFMMLLAGIVALSLLVQRRRKLASMSVVHEEVNPSL